MDPKWRLTLPLQWFARMGSPPEVYVMASLTGEPCLEIFTAADFEARLEKYRDRRLTDERTAAFLREISESAELLTVDSQNRIRIADDLRAHAGLEADVVLLSSAKHLEVWSLARRPRRRGRTPEQVRALADLANQLEF